MQVSYPLYYFSSLEYLNFLKICVFLDGIDLYVYICIIPSILSIIVFHMTTIIILLKLLAIIETKIFVNEITYYYYFLIIRANIWTWISSM